MNIKYFIFILLIFLNYSCSAKKDDSSVLNFFWPLQVGNTFIYENDDGVERIVTLYEIEGDEEIKVLTKESMPKIKYSDFVEYTIDVKKNIIYKKNKSGEKNIFLRGPLTAGTKWPFNYITITPDLNNYDVRAESRSFESQCHIEKNSERLIGQKKRNCIEALCDLNRDNTELFSQTSWSFVFCEHVGLYGVKLDDNEATWLEKLKSTNIEAT